MNERQVSRRQTIAGAVVLVAGLFVLALLMNASDKSGKAHLQEHCRTEATASYRGAVDNERAADWVRTCR